MTNLSKISTIIIETICYLFAFLFTYAAVTKLLELDNFQAQLGQSPMLSAFSNTISWSIPLLEISLALALFIPKYRVIALYGAFALMVTFTAYIYIILNYSSYIPCSCGGILEKMNWKQHLCFNIVFVLFGVIAIILSNYLKSNRVHLLKLIVRMTIIIILCTAFTACLNLISHDISTRQNTFIRNFQYLIKKKYETTLSYNSYYFAGAEQNKIFLGNSVAPFQITILDTSLRTISEPKISLSPNNLKLINGEIRIQFPYFFFIDGSNPCVFRGKLSDWKGYLKWKDSTWFSHPEIIDSINILFKTKNANLERTIGTLNINTGATNFSTNILTKQIDGTFDSDGTLQYDKLTNRMTYLYRYRNQYTVTDHKLKVIARGKTIDTTNRAQIEVTVIENRHERKMSKPPLIVNKGNVVYKNLLFVNAGIMGRYEDVQMWKDASIVDVYNLDTQTYIASFFVYNIGSNKLRTFMVKNNTLFAMMGKNVVSYHIHNSITKEYRL